MTLRCRVQIINNFMFCLDEILYTSPHFCHLHLDVARFSPPMVQWVHDAKITVSPYYNQAVAAATPAQRASALKKALGQNVHLGKAHILSWQNNRDEEAAAAQALETQVAKEVSDGDIDDDVPIVSLSGGFQSSSSSSSSSDHTMARSFSASARNMLEDVPANQRQTPKQTEGASFPTLATPSPVSQKSSNSNKSGRELANRQQDEDEYEYVGVEDVDRTTPSPNTSRAPRASEYFAPASQGASKKSTKPARKKRKMTEEEYDEMNKDPNYVEEEPNRDFMTTSLGTNY